MHLGVAMIGRVWPAACVVAAFLASEAAEARTLVPHRAVYQLELVYTTPDSAIANAVGDLVFQIDDLCEAWSTVTEMRFAVRYDSGEEARFGTWLSAWEKKDGQLYQFQVKRRSTVGRNDSIDGEATIGADGAGEAAFFSPTRRSMALPAGTIFPTAHSIEVIDAAEAGGGTLLRNVFDGTEEDSLYEVSTAIAGQVPADLPAGFDSPLLQGVASWRVALAYFEVIDESGLPAHEATVRLYGNGVIDEQLFDFGDFRLRARMVELEALPEPGC